MQVENRSIAAGLSQNQNLNVDGSGRGSAETLKNNLRLYDALKGQNSTLAHADSTAMGDLIEAGRGLIRVFAIGSSHTEKP